MLESRYFRLFFFLFSSNVKSLEWIEDYGREEHLEILFRRNLIQLDDIVLNLDAPTDRETTDLEQTDGPQADWKRHFFVSVCPSVDPDIRCHAD